LTAARPRALVIDWVGVLTTDFETSVAAWTRSEDLDTQTFMDALAELREAGVKEQANSGMIWALERGEIGPQAFERELASRLRRGTGTAPDPRGLLRRLFSHFQVNLELLAMVRRLRAHGYRTALLPTAGATTTHGSSGTARSTTR
jgi:hypothetical protein